MIYINCPNCGRKLMEGEEGSKVQVKCNKCNRLYRITVESERVELVLASKKV